MNFSESFFSPIPDYIPIHELNPEWVCNLPFSDSIGETPSGALAQPISDDMPCTSGDDDNRISAVVANFNERRKPLTGNGELPPWSGTSLAGEEDHLASSRRSYSGELEVDFTADSKSTVDWEIYQDSQPVEDEDYFSECLINNIAAVPDSEEQNPGLQISTGLKEFLQGTSNVRGCGDGEEDVSSTGNQSFTARGEAFVQWGNGVDGQEVLGSRRAYLIASIAAGIRRTKALRTFNFSNDKDKGEISQAAVFEARKVGRDALPESTASPKSGVVKIGFYGPILQPKAYDSCPEACRWLLRKSM